MCIIFCRGILLNATVHIDMLYRGNGCNMMDCCNSLVLVGYSCTGSIKKFAVTFMTGISLLAIFIAHGVL